MRWWPTILVVASMGFGPVARAEDPFDFSQELRKSIDILPLRDLDAYRRNVSDWDAILRGFRREHNFSVTGGISQSRWKLGRIEPVRTEEKAHGYYYRFQYHYHIKLADHFGYYLGSSFTSLPYQYFKRDEDYFVERSFSIPGLSLGLVWDYSSIFRMLLGIDGHLQRVEHFAYRGSNSAHTRKTTFTTRVLGVYAAVDLFYQLSWAVRLEGAWQRHDYKPPGDADNYDVDMEMREIETMVGLGLVYHLI